MEVYFNAGGEEHPQILECGRVWRENEMAAAPS